MSLTAHGEELLRTASRAVGDYIEALEAAELRHPQERQALLTAALRIEDALSDLLDLHYEADLDELTERELQG